MTFEQYVSEWDGSPSPAPPPGPAERPAKARSLREEPYERCQSCGGSEPVSRDGICRECLRYHYGWDEAEETLVTAMVGGAVKGALETGALPELIAVAVQRALQEHRDRDEEAALRVATKVAEGRR